VNPACTLSAEDIAGMPQRLAGFRRLGAAQLSSHRGERHAVLRFRNDPAIREDVDALVAAESRCCGFLGYRVEEQPEALVLTISAPEGGEPFMLALAEMLAADA
jgi:hypothetical protein